MPTTDQESRKPALGLDWWAVLVAIAATLLIKSGVLAGVPW